MRRKKLGGVEKRVEEREVWKYKGVKVKSWRREKIREKEMVDERIFKPFIC